MSFKIVNSREFSQKLQSLHPKSRMEIKAIMKAAGTTILEKSDAQAPYDTGTLIRSGRSSDYLYRNHTKVEIGYTVNYAIYPHELHKTKSKYLEKAFNNFKSGEGFKTMANRVLRAIEKSQK